MIETENSKAKQLIKEFDLTLGGNTKGAFGFANAMKTSFKKNAGREELISKADAALKEVLDK